MTCETFESKASKDKVSQEAIIIFADSDYQLSNNPKGKFDYPSRKHGLIEQKIAQSKRDRQAGYNTILNIDAGDATDAGLSGKFFGFEFTSAKDKRPLPFILANELEAYKKLVVAPLEENNIEVLATVGNHDRAQSVWGNALSKMTGATETVLQFGLFCVDDNKLKLQRPTLHRDAFDHYLKNKYGNSRYFRQYGELYVVSLGLYPDKAGIDYLKQHIPQGSKIVAFWHYNVDGPFSVEGYIGGTWWTKKERAAAFDVLSEEYDTKLVVVGHLHNTYAYTFRDIPICVSGGSAFARIVLDPQQDYQPQISFMNEHGEAMLHSLETKPSDTAETLSELTM